MSTTLQPYKLNCTMCGDEHTLRIAPADIIGWRNGAYIQDAMPYLSPAERELLISATCGDCFDSLFGEEE